MRDGRPRPPLQWLLGDLFRVEQVHLRSTLDEAAARRALDRYGAITALPADRLAPLDGHEFRHRIVARRRILRRSLPLFCGRIVPTATGSELIGEIRCQRAERVVLTLELLVPIVVTAVGAFLRSGAGIAGAVVAMWVYTWIRMETLRSEDDWGILHATLRQALGPLVVTGR